jgi:hypothetical protein
MANINELQLPDGTTKIIEDGTLWSGHRANWEALTSEEQSKYRYVMFDDDSETGETVDAVTDGDMRAVTSNAVYDALASAIANAFKPQYFNITWNEHISLEKRRVTAFRMSNLVVITAYFETDDTVLDSSQIIGTVPEALKPSVEVQGTGIVTHNTDGMMVGKWTIRTTGNIQQVSTNYLGKYNSFTFVYPINS